MVLPKVKITDKEIFIDGKKLDGVVKYVLKGTCGAQELTIKIMVDLDNSQ